MTDNEYTDIIKLKDMRLREEMQKAILLRAELREKEELIKYLRQKIVRKETEIDKLKEEIKLQNNLLESDVNE